MREAFALLASGDPVLLLRVGLGSALALFVGSMGWMLWRGTGLVESLKMSAIMMGILLVILAIAAVLPKPTSRRRRGVGARAGASISLDSSPRQWWFAPLTGVIASVGVFASLVGKPFWGGEPVDVFSAIGISLVLGPVIAIGAWLKSLF